MRKSVLFVTKFLLIIIVIYIVGRIVIVNKTVKTNTNTQNLISNIEEHSIENISNDINYESVNISNSENYNNIIKDQNNSDIDIANTDKVDITDWKLTLVNYENILPSDFNIELANIDRSRKFDVRAIDELKKMLKDMKKDGIENVWVQSSYRDIKYQENIFNKKVNKYIEEGKTREEAERLTLKTINKPGTSEHNLGLAVDFNYVDYSFDTTKGFKWLKENAENYGFILRYPKEKEDITKIDYEPWHWRYVGVENAKKINQLGMCLEEYIEYNK